MVEVRGAPLSIRLDNGSKFIAHALHWWAESRGIALNHTQPGEPTQNAYVERFDKTYRAEVLDCSLFDSLQEVRAITADWLHRYRYSHQRPHESLKRIPPVGCWVKQIPQPLLLTGSGNRGGVTFTSHTSHIQSKKRDFGIATMWLVPTFQQLRPAYGDGWLPGQPSRNQSAPS